MLFRIMLTYIQLKNRFVIFDGLEANWQAVNVPPSKEMKCVKNKVKQNI